jgi:DNA-binding beta-propeller fold protein YncE
VRAECHELLREARQRIEELLSGATHLKGALHPKAVCPDSPEWYAQMAAFPLPPCPDQKTRPGRGNKGGRLCVSTLVDGSAPEVASAIGGGVGGAMTKQVAFRWVWLSGLLLLLGLSACRRATATPNVPATLSSEGAPVSIATPSRPDVAIHQTGTPQLPSLDVSPTAELPFPALLRRLDFGIPAGNSYYPGPLAVHPGLKRLYVSTLERGSYGHQGGRVTVLDQRSGEVLFVIDTGTSEMFTRALVVDTLRDRVYASSDGDNTCAVLDAVSLDVVTTLADVRGFALDQAGGQVYVAGQAGLRVLDVVEYRVLRESSVSFEGPIEAMAVDPADGRVYVAQMEGGQFLLAQYDVETLERLAETLLPFGCRALLPDPARDRVYLAVGSATDALWAVDGEGQRVEDRLGRAAPYRALALDPAGDRLFAARHWGQQGIVVIDLKSGIQVGEISLTTEVDGLTWDAMQERLWLSLPNTQVGVADPAPGRVLATYPLAADLDQAELLVEGGRLYLTDSLGRLHVLDAGTYDELATLPVTGELIHDPTHHRLYATTWDSPEGSVAVVDTAALTVTKTITPGGFVGWDPTRHRLYVGRFDRGGQVYDTLTLEKLGEMPVGGQVVYNPLRDELLMVARTVYVVDAETLELTADLLPEIGGQACPQCEGALFANEVEVLADRNLLAVTISQTGRGGGCGPDRRFFDATSLEPVTDPVRTRFWEPTCNGRRTLPEPLADRVYEAMWCGSYESYRNLHVYDLQGNLLTWRDGLDTGVVNPNTCQGYVSQRETVLVLDLPSLSPVGTLPKAAYVVDAEAGRVYGLAGSELLVFAEEGGHPEPPPRPGQTGPLPAGEILWIGASPGFDHDRTLFVNLSATSLGGLYRSGDAGTTWARLRGGLPEEGTPALVISPGYVTDHTLFAAGSSNALGVLRSTDGGGTWQPIWEGLTHLAVQSLAVSPQYTTDGTLLAYSTYHDLLHPTGATTSVSRSTDRGLHWTLVATGTVPPPEELLPPDPSSPDLRFRAGYWWGVDRWTSATGSWQRVLRIPSSAGVARAVLPSRDIGTDGTVYVLAESGLFRSTDRGDTWARCPDPRLDGADDDHWPATGVWAGDQLLLATRRGELFFLDPAALRCEPTEVAAMWPMVLSGSYVVEIAAVRSSPDALGSGAALWLVDQPLSRLYRYSAGAVQSPYTTSDGLPRFPSGLALTIDRALWVSCGPSPGVASFDGQTWTSHPLPGLPAGGQVLGIAAGPDGTIWVVTEPPGVYRRAKDAWELLPDPEHCLNGATSDVAVAADGCPWVATGRGMAYYERGAWTAYDLGECAAVAIGPGGEVYGLQPGGLVWRLVEGVWTTLPPLGIEGGLLHTLYAARDGSVWIGADAGAFRYDGQTWQHFTLDSGLPGQKVLAITEDVAGELWFGTDNGAAHIDPANLDLGAVSWKPAGPVPFPTVAPSPTPWTSPTPAPTPGTFQVARAFAAAYSDAWVAALLRLPRDEAVPATSAFQLFERGLMLWRADTKLIYVLRNDGTWSVYGGTWDETQPADDPAWVPPAGLFRPVQAFGKLWRTEAGLASRLGWALSPEQDYAMLAQVFEGGTLLRGPEGEVYALFLLGTWQRR